MEFNGPLWAFEVLDRDGDGYISEPEAVKRPMRRLRGKGPGGGIRRVEPGSGPGGEAGGNMGIQLIPPYAPGKSP